MLKTKIKYFLLILLVNTAYADIDTTNTGSTLTGSTSGTGEVILELETSTVTELEININSSGSLLTGSGIINEGTGILLDGSGSVNEGTGMLSENEINMINLMNRQKQRENTGRILNEFKDQEYEMLFEKITPIKEEDLEIFNNSSKASIYNTIREKVTEKKILLEESRDRIKTRVFNLEETIKELEKSIDNYQAKINKASISVIKLKNNIKETEQEIVILKVKIQQNRKVLLDYIIHLYKKGNIVLGDGKDIDSVKAIILGDGNMGDILSDFYFKGIIELAGQKLIDKHRELLGEIFLKRMTLNTQVNAYNNLKKKFIADKKALKSKSEFREKVLNISKGRQSLFEIYIKEKASTETKLRIKAIKENIKFVHKEDNLLKKYNCDNLTELSKEEKIECIELRKYINSESKLISFNDSFIWPVNPEKGLSAYFHDKEYKKDFGSEHEALDIIIDQGSDIIAPADGYVLYLKNPEDEGYSYMALQHADGYVTVYGHLSNIEVKKYDFIKRGEVFAQTGGAIGTNGAGYMTTGAHLHFEMFKDQMYVDPINYLDISYISVKDIPDNKYIQKYYMDYKNRYGKEFTRSETKNGSVFTLEGDTEIERQKSLLNKYAVGGFNNWNMWIEEALEGKLDPTFLMCIGLAESSLGRNLKTPYNVGNIGNTDSGSTRDFPNPRAGIYWMAKTINNKYLGHYTTLNMLSRYGNISGSIYASSPDHWHNNIVKCVSVIKGRYVKDTFQFRLDF